MPYKRTIASIRRQRSFERSWKGVVVSWGAFLVIVPLFAILFGAAILAIRWSFQQGGRAMPLGALAAAAGVLLWIVCCSPLPIAFRLIRRQARRRGA